MTTVNQLHKDAIGALAISNPPEIANIANLVSTMIPGIQEIIRAIDDINAAALGLQNRVTADELEMTKVKHDVSTEIGHVKAEINDMQSGIHSIH